MSELRTRIDAAWKDAMRARDAHRRDTLNVLRAAIKSAEIELRTGEGEINDEVVQKVIEREAKKRRDAIEEYDKANRPDRAQTEREELLILQEYLPAELTDEELDALTQVALQETGATSAKDIGVLMKALMPRVAGRADGKRVQASVKRAFS